MIAPFYSYRFTRKPIALDLRTHLLKKCSRELLSSLKPGRPRIFRQRKRLRQPWRFGFRPTKDSSRPSEGRNSKKCSWLHQALPFFLNADTVIVVNDLTQRLLFTILVRSAIHDDTSSGLQVVLLRISGMSWPAQREITNTIILTNISILPFTITTFIFSGTTSTPSKPKSSLSKAHALCRSQHDGHPPATKFHHEILVVLFALTRFALS